MGISAGPHGPDFVRSPAEALPACDSVDTVTLDGRRQYILSVIAHADSRIRVPGATAHPNAAWGGNDGSHRQGGHERIA